MLGVFEEVGHGGAVVGLEACLCAFYIWDEVLTPVLGPSTTSLSAKTLEMKKSSRGVPTYLLLPWFRCIKANYIFAYVGNHRTFTLCSNTHP